MSASENFMLNILVTAIISELARAMFFNESILGLSVVQAAM